MAWTTDIQNKLVGYINERLADEAALSPSDVTKMEAKMRREMETAIMGKPISRILSGWPGSMREERARRMRDSSSYPTAEEMKAADLPISKQDKFERQKQRRREQKFASSLTNAVSTANENVMSVERLVEAMKSLPPLPWKEYDGLGSPMVGQCRLRQDGGASIWSGERWVELTAKAFNAIQRDFPTRVETEPVTNPIDPAFPRRLDLE